MSKFGWSLPPGCGTLPGEEPVSPCEICGRDTEIPSQEGGCICPECHCGEVGYSKCYEEHGLIRTQLQIDGRRKLDEQIEAEIKAEQEF